MSAKEVFKIKNITNFKKVLIIGAGYIGLGWAHLFSRKGLETLVFDSNPEALKKLKNNLVKEFEIFEAEGIITSTEKEESLSRIKMVDSLKEAVKGVDYIQECIPENLELKQKLFNKLDEMTNSDVIIASSVSTLPLTEIVKDVKYPGRCVVAHPTNPPHIIPLVEVVPGKNTAQETTEITYKFMEYVGQKPIKCKEIFGYVLNRLQFALVKEAFYLTRNGYTGPEDIDRCITEGLGLRWAFTGPYMTGHLNADNVKQYLSKYSGAINDIMKNLGDHIGPDEKDIEIADNAITEIAESDMTHGELLDWRVRKVLALRKLKID